MATIRYDETNPVEIARTIEELSRALARIAVEKEREAERMGEENGRLCDEVHAMQRGQAA